MGIALTLHALAATLWVGGMFFALVCLRPAAAEIEASARLKLWAGTLGRFLPWVEACAAVLLATGLWMIFAVLGGMRAVGAHVHIMLGLGIVMMLMALHVYFAPLRRLKQAVAGAHWAEAGKKLNQIRVFITINLVLGLIVIAVASGGRYFFHK